MPIPGSKRKPAAQFKLVVHPPHHVPNLLRPVSHTRAPERNRAVQSRLRDVDENLFKSLETPRPTLVPLLSEQRHS